MQKIYDTEPQLDYLATMKLIQQIKEFEIEISLKYISDIRKKF